MQPQAVDLSSFPLLRIDQIPHHETRTLVESEAILSAFEHDADILAITPFISKLLTLIRKEIVNRKKEDVNAHDVQTTVEVSLPTTTSVAATQGGSTQPSLKTKRINSPPPSFVVFGSPKLKSSSNFRSRAKLAKASLHARSNEAISVRLEQERCNRTRQALKTMREWRREREKARNQREERLNKERKLQLDRWNAKLAREQEVHTMMHAAAEEAKQKALDSGCSREEAVVEAAAAASKVVDLELTTFEFVDTHSDDGSFIDKDCTDDENIMSHAFPCTEIICLDDNRIYTDPDSSRSSQSEANHLSAVCAPNLSANISIDEKMSNLFLSTPKNEQNEGSTDLPNMHVETSPPTSEQQINTDIVSTSAKSSAEILSGKIEAREDISRFNDHAGQSNFLEQTIPPEQSMPILDREKNMMITVPIDAETSLSFSALVDTDITSETKQCVEYPAKKERQPRDTFPPLPEIFTHLCSGLKNATSADAKQRELSKLFMYHFEQYTEMKTIFEALNEDVGCHSEDNLSYNSFDSFTHGLFYRIKSNRPEVMSIVRKAFADRLLSHWDELPLDIERNVWNLMWVWGLPNASTFDNLLTFQKINRFRDTRGLTRKDLLKKNIQRCCNTASTKDEESFNIMPLTYALPHEFNSFISGYQSMLHNQVKNSSNYWIIKPVGLSRGRGISIVNDIADVSYSRPVVVQRYITNPLCFMGFKFDLRMYILVTSFSPLEAFIYKEGLARFGSKQYALTPELLHDRRIHLTNSSVQQEFSEDIDRSHPAYLAGAHGFESKVAFSWLWKRLDERGFDTNAMWVKLTDVCRKALVASGSDIPYQPNSFEIFGYDLIFDQNLKCWLLEVNSSPSLACESPLDTRIKGSLIRDTIALVDPPAYDRKVLSTICERRIRHCQTAAKKNSNSDVAQILLHRAQRKFGEIPMRMGNYERIAPISSKNE